MQGIKSKIKQNIRFMLDIFLLAYGLIYYLLNHKKPLHTRTPGKAHLSMIRLFCKTSGLSNDILSKCISFFDKSLKLPDANGILGMLSDAQLHQITRQLEEDGFYIFEQKLPEEIVKRLYSFAQHEECVPRKLDHDNENTPTIKIHFDKNNPKSSVYDVPTQSAIANADVQAILSDHSILAVAQHYLKTSPKVEPISFWWSAPFGDKPQINSAQLFHFDMDRIKWIKFFVFLTDVTIENGPHVFIKHSHRSGQIPAALLAAGYSRLSDEDVFKHYPKDDIQTFTIPAGTILAEDTRGLHKGTNLKKGERLVLELQFSNSYFGAVTTPVKEPKIQDNRLQHLINRYPRIFKLYST